MGRDGGQGGAQGAASEDLADRFAGESAAEREVARSVDLLFSPRISDLGKITLRRTATKAEALSRHPAWLIAVATLGRIGWRLLRSAFRDGLARETDRSSLRRVTQIRTGVLTAGVANRP